MASLDKRTSSKGKVSYRVRWREGGKRTGAWESATFTRLQQARDFKARVEANDHRWPTDTTGAVSAPGTMTVDQLAADYLDDRARRVRSDRTVADYRRDHAKWIAPFLGAVMADVLTAEQVQAWVDAMGEGTLSPTLKPAAPKSVRDRHALLSGILTWGVRHDQADRNVCEDTRLPKGQKGAPKGLRPAEWQALHAALRQIDPDAADLALFLLGTGWRWSEATALTTFDVEDYGPGAPLFVTMGQVFRRNAAGQRVAVAEGKGQASVRRVKVSPEAAAMIRRRMTGLAPGSLVLTTARGAQWHESNFRNRAWRPAVKAANLSRHPTPHWLRHTAVVWLHNAGASLPDLQARIGHASITTTIGVYGRMLTDVSDDALTGFDAMITGALPQSGNETREIVTPQ